MKQSKPKVEGNSAYQSIRSRIVRCYPQLTPQQQHIAHFALGNPNAMAMQTSQQLAAQLQVQPSSLVRFAQALGYRGFIDMKHGFKENLIYRLGEESEREQLAKQPATGTIAVLDALLSEARHDLDKTSKAIDRRAFDKAVGEISLAEHVYVVGQQLSLPLACTFAWTLLHFGRSCHLLDNLGGFALQNVELSRKDDIVVAISFPPYQSSVIQCAKHHFDAGGRVVSITDGALSPLASVSHVTVEVPQRTPLAARPFLAAGCVVQALAIAVGEKGATGKVDQKSK